MMNYYEQAQMRYASATAEQRKASRDHWLKCHKENLESGREDLIIFSAQMLAVYDIVDAAKMRRAKATTQDKASRAYRLGKINAEKQAGVLSAAFCDCIEYAEEIEWDCETINGIATAYTDFKGELVSIHYYED